MTRFRGAFSLIEMLLATALVAVLTAALLALLGGVNRDIRTMRSAADRDRGFEAALDLLSRDLGNALEFSRSDAQPNTIRIMGNIGIDRDTLASNGRLARVTYRVDRNAALHREQQYLDDPDRPQRWDELAAVGVSELAVSSGSSGHVRVTLQTARQSLSRDVRMQ